MSSYSTSNSRTSRAGPPMVVADLPNGCESTSCYIAQTFYNCCVHEITKINSRNKLRDFFVKSQPYWMPPNLTERGENRHFDQVLYALVNDGGVCRIKKSDDGSHRVTWAINHVRGPKTHPRKRINSPHAVQPIMEDIEEGRGSPLTMEDLSTASYDLEEGEERSYVSPGGGGGIEENYCINIQPLHRSSSSGMHSAVTSMR